MSSSKFYTIGYEGKKLDDFILSLKQNHVTRIIDVREIPLSRKKGFSKSALKQKLESEKIEYVHIKSLGSPKPIRDKLKKDYDYPSFFNSYSNYLTTQMDSLKELYKFITSGINCLMCFEKTPEICHRSTLANKLKDFNNSLVIKHI